MAILKLFKNIVCICFKHDTILSILNIKWLKLSSTSPKNVHTVSAPIQAADTIQKSCFEPTNRHIKTTEK